MTRRQERKEMRVMNNISLLLHFAYEAEALGTLALRDQLLECVLAELDTVYDGIELALRGGVY